MKIEIAICTWNRARLLQQTLTRLCELNVPSGVELSLIVVDNGSNDDTPEVIDRFAAKFSLLSLSENQRGHTFARNRAIEAAGGDWLLWIDDDVIVGADWLETYFEAARTHLDVSFYGGPILPKFDHRHPKWIDANWEKLKGCFAFRDLGNRELDFTHNLLPYGANFAIRTDLQKQFLFDVGLGRSANTITGDDDLNLFRRMIDQGLTGKWLPNAPVEHVIDDSRTNTAYIGRYFVGQGKALVAKGEAWTSNSNELLKEANHELFWFRIKRYCTPSDVWISHLIRGSLARGQFLAMEAAKDDKVF